MRRRAILVSALLALFLMPVLAHSAEVTEEWVRTFDSGNSDEAWDVAVDSSGNVIITGAASGAILTVKYDSAGNQLWFDRAADVSGQSTWFSFVAVDGADNVYVVSNNYNTIKYDSDGNKQWTIIKPYWGEADSIGVDASGNVYVAGWGNNPDRFYTVKYDTDGNELWSASHDGGYWGWGMDLAIDALGNVYVTGYVGTDGTNSGSGYMTLKYNTDGNLLWERLYLGDNVQWAYDMAIDSSGNVYVTGDGKNRTTGTYDFLTIKYDTDGNFGWENRCVNCGYAWFVGADSSGNSYVIGDHFSPQSTTIVKYDADGNESWANSYDNLKTTWKFQAAVDNSGNVYLAGELNNNLATVKYDTSGNIVWEQFINNIYPSRITAVALDTANNVYVAGSSNSDFTTIKYSQGPSTIPDLITLVQQMHADGRIYNQGFATTLTSMLTNAQASLDAGNNGAAINALNAAINHIQGGSGMMIDPAAATELIGYINQIIAGIQV